MLDLLIGTALAQEGGAPPPPGGGGFQLLLFFGAIIAIWWFLVIRPQTKQAQRHKAMVTALKRGDQVVTTSGMFGKVAAVDETTVTLEVGKGVKIKFLKDKVARMSEPPAAGKSESVDIDKKK